ncbi:Uncharacterised protein [Salmonella enterica subsp. diarizonae]|uniref:Uncharacterized protein n=1 Tax=Salmonella diarizonae TaxID=59204 RepID=A0A379TWN7_SALDZ|nr:Uncharacterised protein [Salmonella enterica subsp. diarizonae]
MMRKTLLATVLTFTADGRSRRLQMQRHTA